MTERTIVVDIDGCLADFCWGFSGLLGRPHSNGQQKTWLFDSPATDIARAWARVDESKRWWLDLPPLVTEPEVYDLGRLARDVRFVYMTGREDRGNDTLEQTTRWLKMMGLPQGAVILEGDKVRGVGNMQRSGVDVIAVIDDRPRTLTRLAHDLGSTGLPVFARRWAYNEPKGLCDENGDDGACRIPMRVGSMGEFVREVRSILENH